MAQNGCHVIYDTWKSTYEKVNLIFKNQLSFNLFFVLWVFFSTQKKKKKHKTTIQEDTCDLIKASAPNRSTKDAYGSIDSEFWPGRRDHKTQGCKRAWSSSTQSGVVRGPQSGVMASKAVF